MKSKMVREIPANPFLRDARKLKKNLRVAAYCRVSTEEEEQQSSFEIQVEYYTNKIASHDNWTLAGIFADDGISGVHVKNRTQFLEMIELCKKKKIDLILTKSISRFARNTLECIQYVRMLKALGIPVIFEKEGINTADMTSEMLLTCLSSFAQAESESISLNVARGKRMGYKQGKFSFRYTNFLGYRKGADGQPEIVPAQADAIQMMFQSYLNGDSLFKIKEALENKGIHCGAWIRNPLRLYGARTNGRGAVHRAADLCRPGGLWFQPGYGHLHGARGGRGPGGGAVCTAQLHSGTGAGGESACAAEGERSRIDDTTGGGKS